uniref:Integrase catalytic domain-containing protein n=1 Tax=Nippostrongylus brasiliensis TaxID=27835 RepID=A0A0N4Y146_NIPBR
LINESHVRCGHQVVNGTLANIRLKYWVPKARQIVRKCLRRCIICKKWSGKPYHYPASPPLPMARTSPTRPFSHIGIDLAGPFRVLDPEKQEQKRWIFLSTCMTTRAVHLETVNDLGAIKVIHVLRRFIARRGKPQVIISDNATNFKASNDIFTSVDSEAVQHYLANEKIQWRFITPLSPWKDGFYERVIGIMKSVLKRKIRRKQVDESAFITIVTECEAMKTLVIRPIDFILPFANIAPITNRDETIEKNNCTYSPNFPVETKPHSISGIKSDILENSGSMEPSYLLELRNYHQRIIKQTAFIRRQPIIGELRTARSTIERSINLLIPLELDIDKTEQSVTDKGIETKGESAERPINNGDNDNPHHADAQNTTTTKRTRPFLPRCAKENKNYVLIISSAPGRDRLSDFRLCWKHWLTIAVLTSAISTAHTQKEDNSRNTRLAGITGGANIAMLQPTEKI